MKTEKNILIAFLLNSFFSVFEFVGGILTGSVAIVSDALHDVGDAVGIGISYFLEKKSKKQPDETCTYGYARYSVLGGLMTALILLISSVVVISNAVCQMFSPEEIHYDGMIVFALFGVCVNFCAALFTRHGESLNQKVVNLHMLEDVLGWVIVLLGAVVMRFTDFALIDPLMSIGVAAFILIHAIQNLKEGLDLILEKTPRGMSVKEIRGHVAGIEGVLDVHHIHLWSMDGQRHYATMHVVTDSDVQKIKEKVREELLEHGIAHATLEMEDQAEQCLEKNCCIKASAEPMEHHHHHHHHH